jgi:hypothetical protein
MAFNDMSENEKDAADNSTIRALGDLQAFAVVSASDAPTTTDELLNTLSSTICAAICSSLNIALNEPETARKWLAEVPARMRGEDAANTLLQVAAVYDVMREQDARDARAIADDVDAFFKDIFNDSDNK